MDIKPEWLKIKYKMDVNHRHTSEILSKYNLTTVCAEAGCPNECECYSKGTATFMILGSNCTRNCKFCLVSKETPCDVDVNEPLNVAKAVEEMKLKHVVITSVTRDDLQDGGACHFAETINQIRLLTPSVTIEVLIPDFQGDLEALKVVIDAKPDIINHNVETIEKLYDKVRPMADYYQSLEVLKRVKLNSKDIISKSGFMVGLGESEDEVLQLLNDLKRNDCEMVTIGQYLQPSEEQLDVVEYVTPNKFKFYENQAKALGFKHVFSGPFVRSSYLADQGMLHKGD